MAQSRAVVASTVTVSALLFGLSVVAAVEAPPPARAPDPELELEPEPEPKPKPKIGWQAPPGCGGGEELVARTEALLGRPLGEPGDPELELDGRVEAVEGGLLLRLEFHRPSARTRELHGASCEELIAAAAIVLAVAVDPFAPLDIAEDEPQPDASPEPQPDPAEPSPDPDPRPAPKPEKPEPPASATPPPSRAPARELGGFVRLSGGLQYPTLPTLAGGPSLALGLRWRALRAELVGGLWLAGDARFDEAPEVGARLTLGYVAPRLCGVPALGRVELPLCAGVELGGLRGAGFGTSSARTQTLAWVAAELGGAASIDLGRSLALWLGVDAIVPVTRPSFSVAGLGELHRAPWLAFEALLGLEIHFGGGRMKDPRPGGQGEGG